jgi:hypothetical protein
VAALAEIDQQIADGRLIIRQATAEERDRLGITAVQERLRRERQEEQPRRPRPPVRKPTPPDPTLGARLRAARRSEQEAPGALNALILTIAASGLLSMSRVAEIAGVSASSVFERRQRAAAAGAAPVAITDPEAQLRDARACELRAPGELDDLMLSAAADGMTVAQIAEAIGLARKSTSNRLCAARRRRTEATSRG